MSLNNSFQTLRDKLSPYAKECIENATGFEVRYSVYTACYATLEAAVEYANAISVCPLMDTGIIRIETVHSGDENFRVFEITETGNVICS